MITHYLPQWLLSKFRGETLYEYDIFTAVFRGRSIKNAGSSHDLWSAQLEHGLLRQLDNDAARIFRERIVDKNKIYLTPKEKHSLAEWLAFFMARVPYSERQSRELLEQFVSNKDRLIELLRENPDGLAEQVYAGNPGLKEKLLGHVDERIARELILAEAERRMLDSGYKPNFPPVEMRETALATIDRQKYASILMQFQWTWLQSSHGFVIGDNPLVRWHVESNRWNFGIGRRGVEISFPFTPSLCLLMHAPQTRAQPVLHLCNREMTRVLNDRQRYAAERFVYSGTPSLLDEIAKAVWPIPPRALR